MDPEDPGSYTFNPAKPRLIMKYLERKGLIENFLIDGDFPPLPREDFYIAHTKEMVEKLTLNKPGKPKKSSLVM